MLLSGGGVERSYNYLVYAILEPLFYTWCDFRNIIVSSYLVIIPRVCSYLLNQFLTFKNLGSFQVFAILYDAASILFGNKAISKVHTSLSVPRSGDPWSRKHKQGQRPWHIEFKCCLKGRTPHPLPLEGSIVPTMWRPHGLLAGGHAETCPEDVKEGEKGPREQETLHRR